MRNFFSALFNGAPNSAEAEKYTAQVTAAISLYLCFVAVFVIGLYIRRRSRAETTNPEGNKFKIWIAWSLVFSIVVIALYVGVFLFSTG